MRSFCERSADNIGEKFSPQISFPFTSIVGSADKSRVVPINTKQIKSQFRRGMRHIVRPPSVSCFSTSDILDSYRFLQKRSLRFFSSFIPIICHLFSASLLCTTTLQCLRVIFVHQTPPWTRACDAVFSLLMS